MDVEANAIFSVIKKENYPKCDFPKDILLVTSKKLLVKRMQ